MVQATGKDGPQTPHQADIEGMSKWDETQENFGEIMAGLGTSQKVAGELEEVSEERDIWASMTNCYPRELTAEQVAKNGGMNDYIII